MALTSSNGVRNQRTRASQPLSPLPTHLYLQRRRRDHHHHHHQLASAPTGITAPESTLEQSGYERMYSPESNGTALTKQDARDVQWVVIPEEGSWKLKWDILILALILYSSVVVPFRVNFNADPEGAIWMLEVGMSFCFLVDLIFAFFTAYYDGEKGEWVTSRSQIAAVYLRGWFWIDAPASLPLELLDLVPGFQDASQFRMLRFLRMFRLLRLLKLLKINDIIDALEEHLQTNLRLFHVVFMLIKVAFVAHILGCFWFGVGVASQISTDSQAWFTVYAQKLALDDDTEPHERLMWEHYLWSVYWALTTLTTVGYGDITPTNSAEQAYECFALLIGGLIFGYLLSQVGVLVASLDRQTALIEEKLDNVKEYAESRCLPRPLIRRLRKHFKYFYTRQPVFDELQLLSDCPPALQSEITRFILSEKLGKLPLFTHVIDPEFQVSAVPYLGLVVA